MSDVRVVHKSEVGYNEHGDSVYSTESYIKILAGFKESALGMLKGAPLSVFICVACHEADEHPGASLRTMQGETKWSRPSVIEAVRFLTDSRHRFIEIAGQEADGTNIYRVAAYAWFGTKAPQGSSIPREPKHERASSIRQTQPDGRVSPIHPPTSTSVRGGQVALPPPPVRTFNPPLHDDDVNFHDLETSEIEHHHDLAGVREILQGGGFRGKRLEEIAGLVTEAEARSCVDWIAQAKRVPGRYREPYGYVYTLAKAHSIAALPAIEAPEVTDEDAPVDIPGADVFGVGEAGRLWREVLCAMAHQVDPLRRQALYDSRVVEFESAATEVWLTVFDASPGHFLKRMEQTLGLTLSGITGKHCELTIVVEPGVEDSDE